MELSISTWTAFCVYVGIVCVAIGAVGTILTLIECKCDEQDKHDENHY